MSILIYKNDQQEGPYDHDTIRQGLASGRFTPDDFAFQDGCSDWVPLHTLVSVETRVPVVPTQAISKKPEQFDSSLTGLLGKYNCCRNTSQALARFISIVSAVTFFYGTVKLLIMCLFQGVPFFVTFRLMSWFDLACLIIGGALFVSTFRYLLQILVDLRVSELTSSANLKGPATILSLSVVGGFSGFLLRPTFMFMGQELPAPLTEQAIFSRVLVGSIIGAVVGFCIWRIFLLSSSQHTPIPNTLAQLEHLADLQERGIISEAEFQIEKGKLLARK